MILSTTFIFLQLISLAMVVMLPATHCQRYKLSILVLPTIQCSVSQNLTNVWTSTPKIECWLRNIPDVGSPHIFGLRRLRNTSLNIHVLALLPCRFLFPQPSAHKLCWGCCFWKTQLQHLTTGTWIDLQITIWGR
uniref:Secreted protein n=1 Tax=Micrurus spixii TaxID=129469 RepID=A0A2D4MX75_9SAUR